MNRREKDTLKVLHSKLGDIFDTLESTTDSDIDCFENEKEEREGAPVQYAARKVFEVMERIERLVDWHDK